MHKKIFIGLFAGITCGLFGTGGGMILVPGLMYVLKIESRESRATSISCMLPMVITSSFFYYQNSYIDSKISLLCALGGIIGGIFGAKILNIFPDRILKIVFICFLIYASIKFILG